MTFRPLVASPDLWVGQMRTVVRTNFNYQSESQTMTGARWFPETFTGLQNGFVSAAELLRRGAEPKPGIASAGESEPPADLLSPWSG